MPTLDQTTQPLAFIAAIASGLIGGVFFAFSAFVLRALHRLPAAEGIAAMQSINVVVINPVFLGVFLGNAAVATVSVVVALLRWQSPVAPWLLAGGVLYFAGTFLVTVAGNVPLNDALAAVSPTAPEAGGVWERYVARWGFWNHVRTLAAVAAAVAFTVALRR